ncbi:MAG: TonB family protein [Chthoniobacterales bacterium]
MLVTAILAAFTAEAEDLSKIPEIRSPRDFVRKPNIQYPYEAKRERLTGSGVVVWDINPATGDVLRVRMGQSTGHAILDQAAVSAFRTAHFRNGTTTPVKIPISFSLSNEGPGPYVVQAENMDDVLAAFLGKGTVKKGPIPAYPRYPKWTTKSGKGVYELHADKDGKVFQVKILNSSGDATFDREAVKTLGKWRLARGPLVIELPLRFKLTPTNYSVDVGR